MSAFFVFHPFSTVFAETTFVDPSPLVPKTVRLTNENWLVVPHPKVHSFTVLDDGSAYGLTETGVPFVQENVPNTLGIRIQRFSIEDHYHYIVEGKEVYTLKEISAEIVQAYEKRHHGTSA